MKLVMVTVYESDSLRLFEHDWNSRFRVWTKGSEDEVDDIFEKVVDKYHLTRNELLNEAAGVVKSDNDEAVYMHASLHSFPSSALEERFPEGVLYCSEISWPFDIPEVRTESCSSKLNGVLDCIEWHALM